MTDPVKGSAEWIKAEQAKVSKAGGSKSCLGCLGFIVVIAIAFTACSMAMSGGSSSTPDNSYEAIAQCEARIDNLLKAPATADYDSSASGSGNGPWNVAGTVDAENSFGAQVRATYACTVTMSGDTATTTVDSFTG